MPEGDSLHRAARRLQPLVGERLEVETPHPRAAATGVADQLDGRRLESVEAVGKNLILRFEGGLVLRSHLRMTGRWTLRARGAATRGRPWLVLRGGTREAVLWGGPVLELNARAVRRLGPDILDRPPDFDAMVAASSPSGSAASRGRHAARPAPGLRDRQPLEGRVALACAGLPVETPRRTSRTRSYAQCSARRRG